MSDRRLLAALLLLASAAPLPGQQDPALLARRDSLRARAEALNERLKVLGAAARDSGLTAQLRVGPMRVRTSETLKPVATAAFATAFAEVQRVLGGDADSLGAHLVLTLREHRSSNRYRRITPFQWVPVDTTERITSASLEGAYDGREVPGVTLTYPIDRKELTASALGVMERAGSIRLPAPLEPWLNHRLPLRANQAEFGPMLYRNMATADAAIVRRCSAGDRQACRLGFALDSVPADRVTAWYDASDLPTLARSAGDPMQRSWMFRSIGTDEQDACTGQHQLEACRRMLALLPADAFRIPMPDAARASLTRLALDIGGADGLARLRAASDATIGGQLAAIAGLPVDELLGRWMQQVVAARPASPLPSATFVLASLACLGVCLIWAMRGKPWS